MGTDFSGWNGDIEKSPVLEKKWNKEKFEKALQVGGVNSVKEKVWECYEKSRYEFNGEFWKKVKDIPRVGSETCNKIAKALGIECSCMRKDENKKSKQNVDADTTLPFENGSSRKYFTFDFQAWTHVEEIVRNPDDRKLLEIDFNWFIEVMRKDPKDRGKYYNNVDNKDNGMVIDKFCNLKNGKLVYFPEQVREELKQYLKGIYADR